MFFSAQKNQKSCFFKKTYFLYFGRWVPEGAPAHVSYGPDRKCVNIVLFGERAVPGLTSPPECSPGYQRSKYISFGCPRIMGTPRVVMALFSAQESDPVSLVWAGIPQLESSRFDLCATPLDALPFLPAISTVATRKPRNRSEMCWKQSSE